MKKLYITSILSVLLAFTGMAQITCNASFVTNQAQGSSTMVQFVNNSTVSQYSQVRYIWNFGDGTIDSSITWNTNRSHNYSNVGTFYVSLKMEVSDSVTNAIICTSYDYDTIVIGSLTTVTASSSALQTASGSTVINFQGLGTKNSSVPSYSTYKWNFGDGSSSTLQNPSHTYATSGNFTVVFTHEVRDSVTSSIIARATSNNWVTPGRRDTCNVSLNSNVSPNQLQVYFSPNSQASSFQGKYYAQNFTWDFGDGNTSTSQWGVNHTYAQSGTYNVTLYMQAIDSVTQAVFCLDTAFGTVTVTHKTPPSCQASYYLDTLASGGNALFIYNNSTPGANDPNYNVTYNWYFGDGDSSNLPYPTHTYSSPGLYSVCLSVHVVDTNYIGCYSYYCDTIGIDSLGNVIYKNSGFTLNVLDPSATVGQKEFEVLDVKVYPNPASNFVNVEGLKEGAEWSLYNIQGAQMASGYLQPGESKIDFGNKQLGLYVLTLKSRNTVKSVKLSIN
ncbi:PKD domain-containing protein [Owenweeksia hongkongensis]|uniref:T9SS type A sorting domain-containing protein n=1 Tax=Owenweeksia hongkongensis TaxID=253245 RepID=UPI003A8CCC48